MKKSSILMANLKDGTRAAFNFDLMKWTPAELTEGHKCDGSKMCLIMAEVNADVNCVKIDNLFWAKA